MEGGPVREKRSKRTKRPHKVRVKLPGIECYEKELEFPAEGPGRVIVRLERLMGSDRIRITDPKYLSTLSERLEAEETQSWSTRSRLRKKAEKNRSRQLAIEGLMEPAEDMQDLWNHPVFRVNRILNRLAVFDYNMSILGAPSDKIPAITQIEPFSDDESGAIFKSYPGHNIFYFKDLPFSTTSLHNRKSVVRSTFHSIKLRPDEEVLEEESQKEAPKKTSTAPVSRGSKVSFADLDIAEEDEEDEENDEGDEEIEEVGDDNDDENVEKVLPLEQPKSIYIVKPEPDPDRSLSELQKLYGVPSDEDLVAHWQPYKASLVTEFCENEKNAKDLFATGNDVVGVYLRQQLKTDDYVDAHGPSVPLNETSLDDLLAIEVVPETIEGEEEGKKKKRKGRRKKCAERKKERAQGDEEEEGEEEGDEEEEEGEEDEEEDEEEGEGGGEEAGEGEGGDDDCVDDDDESDDEPEEGEENEEEEDQEEEENVEEELESIEGEENEDTGEPRIGETAEDRTYFELGESPGQNGDE